MWEKPGTNCAFFEHELDNEISNVIDGTIAKSTKAYASGFKLWCDFCNQLNASQVNPNIQDARRFLVMFRNSKSARQYVSHITHAWNKLGLVQPNIFRSDPCKQFFRGLLKREARQGWGPKPKPIFSESMIIFLVKGLKTHEPTISCMIVLAFTCGFRVNNELIPAQWLEGGHSVCEIIDCGDLVKVIRFTLVSRKNRQGGAVIERNCLCTRIALVTNNADLFNPLCPVHAVEAYKTKFPERFTPGSFMFPKGLRGHLACSAKAMVTVVRRYIVENSSFFTGVIEQVDFVSSHAFRRAMANVMLARDASLTDIYGFGQWSGLRSSLSYVPPDKVSNRAILNCFLEESSSDDERQPGSNQRPVVKERYSSASPVEITQVREAEGVFAEDMLVNAIRRGDDEQFEDVFASISINDLDSDVIPFHPPPKSAGRTANSSKTLTGGVPKATVHGPSGSSASGGSRKRQGPINQWPPKRTRASSRVPVAKATAKAKAKPKPRRQNLALSLPSNQVPADGVRFPDSTPT